jgi:hypothetical protein
MANILTASIYGYQGNPNYTTNMGIEIGFPTSHIIIKPLSPPIGFQGVDCNSTIEIVTSQVPFPIFYSSETAYNLIYGANN